jgi:hypothetical protein
VAIRGVESSDALSRFWDRAIAGRTEIALAVEAQPDGAISPAMADAAVPFERDHPRRARFISRAGRPAPTFRLEHLAVA